MNTTLVIVFMSLLNIWSIQIDPRPFTYESCMQEKKQLEQRSSPKQIKIFCLEDTND